MPVGVPPNQRRIRLWYSHMVFGGDDMRSTKHLDKHIVPTGLKKVSMYINSLNWHLWISQTRP